MRVPLSVSGKGWPNGHFLSGLGSPAPQTACRPQTSNHEAFAHAMPAPGCLLTLPPRLVPVRVPSLLGLKARVISFFPRALSHIFLPHGLRTQRCLVSSRCPSLCSAQSPGNLSGLHCISASIGTLAHLLLWAPFNWGLGLCILVWTKLERTAPHCPADGGRDQTPPSRDIQPVLLPGASKLAFFPENLGPATGETCSLISPQRWSEGGPT